MKERLLNAKKENEMSWLLFCCALVIVVLIIAIVNNKILMRVQVFGPSMNNTLYGGEMSADGDYVGGDILLAVRNIRPERGEIVVISGKKPGALIIKRVIGVGGIRSRSQKAAKCTGTAFCWTNLLCDRQKRREAPSRANGLRPSGHISIRFRKVSIFIWATTGKTVWTAAAHTGTVRGIRSSASCRDGRSP